MVEEEMRCKSCKVRFYIEYDALNWLPDAGYKGFHVARFSCPACKKEWLVRRSSYVLEQSSMRPIK